MVIHTYRHEKDFSLFWILENALWRFIEFSCAIIIGSIEGHGVKPTTTLAPDEPRFVCRETHLDFFCFTTICRVLSKESHPHTAAMTLTKAERTNLLLHTWSLTCSRIRLHSVSIQAMTPGAYDVFFWPEMMPSHRRDAILFLKMFRHRQNRPYSSIFQRADSK